jgi:acyl-CoA synthetase (AMP-forming)/AMP-acid ligase II
MLAVELARRGARRHARRTAMVVDDREFTFAEVDARANRIANVLASNGLGRGDRVGLLVNNGEWSIPLEIGCLKAGVARVPLNARLSCAEHARMIGDTGARLVIHGAELTERAQELAGRVDGLRLAGIGARERAVDLDLIEAIERVRAVDPNIPARADDVVSIMFTSGTTGTLKAAQHTQRSWAAMTANILANVISPGRDSAMLHAASLIHASGCFVMPYWMRGGRAVVLPGFEPEQYLDTLDRHHVTEINLVPTMVGMLFSGDLLDDPARAASLDTIIYGASPMPRPVLERGLARFGPRFVQYFGQTEAPLCIAVLDKIDHTDPALLAAAGQPAVDAELMITDDTGVAVAPGEVGEVRVRSAFTMIGYLNEPELTARTLTSDGWIRTRDLGRMDERGYLYLVDRASDMIVSGGYNVYPREVEDALCAHPSVAECAVVGAPDDLWVEAVTAFVTLRPGARATADELRASVRERLAGYKVPKRVEIVESIPKSPVGKILRRALREPLWADSERSR